ncbi:hypothetical protein LTS15_010256 [Exophiala xenobiotica]|nr:hypothetical protein LTS15_010256 [Exophiala xenobiotica]
MAENLDLHNAATIRSIYPGGIDLPAKVLAVALRNNACLILFYYIYSSVRHASTFDIYLMVPLTGVSS